MGGRKEIWEKDGRKLFARRQGRDVTAGLEGIANHIVEWG